MEEEERIEEGTKEDLRRDGDERTFLRKAGGERNN